MNPLSPARLGFGFGALAIAALGFVVPTTPPIHPSLDLGGGGWLAARQAVRRHDDDELLLMVLL